MALIEIIQQMRAQKMSDSQIVKALSEENFTPVQINEAFNQIKVKDIVRNEYSAQQQEQLTPSIMDQSQEGLSEMPSSQAQMQPQFQEQPQAQMQYANQAEQYYDPNQQYPQTGTGAGAEEQGYEQTYAGYPNSNQEQYYSQAIDLETIKDIAKQLIEQELEKIKSGLSDVSKLRTELVLEMKSMDARLTKIENTISELQSAIIRKVGEYGESISDLSSELHATQESFSKLINPIIDEKRKIMKPQQTQQNQKNFQKNQQSRSQKAKPGFEDYFRQ